MRTSIYKKIKDKIILETNIPTFRYNNQENRIKEGSTIPLPSFYIEFDNIDYETLQDKYQRVECVVRIHLLTENHEDELDHMIEIKDKLVRVLHKWDPLMASTNLVRISEEVDYDHDSLNHHMVDFSFAYIDYVGSEEDYINYVLNRFDISINNWSNVNLINFAITGP